MELSKPKLKKTKTAADDAMDLDDEKAERVMSCLRPQGAGVSKKKGKGSKNAKVCVYVYNLCTGCGQFFPPRANRHLKWPQSLRCLFPGTS